MEQCVDLAIRSLYSHKLDRLPYPHKRALDITVVILVIIITPQSTLLGQWCVCTCMCVNVLASVRVVFPLAACVYVSGLMARTAH